MTDALLRPEVQRWIREQMASEIHKLALQKNPFPDIPYPILVNQVAAREKCRQKLPDWFSTQGILYPEKLSVEQTSSEVTAVFKSELISGKSLFDATGGFGVDDRFFAQKFDRVVHCEQNPELSQIVNHNAQVLGTDNLEAICADSSDYLEKTAQTFDWLYVDPSRRHESKGKVFRLSDCAPNVPELLDLYFKKADSILLKTSPMLDISTGLSELKNVAAIYVVALANEVKELLWLLKNGFDGPVRLFTANLRSDYPETIEWSGAEQTAPLLLPSTYLYEPDAALRKAGVFEEIALKFGLGKLHRNTHLYTSETLLNRFPGRTFKIDRLIPYQKNDMKTFLQGGQANVSARNFPESVAQLRTKWKIRDGGETYAFFTTDLHNKKIVLLCSKLNNP